MNIANIIAAVKPLRSCCALINSGRAEAAASPSKRPHGAVSSSTGAAPPHTRAMALGCMTRLLLGECR